MTAENGEAISAEGYTLERSERAFQRRTVIPPTFAVLRLKITAAVAAVDPDSISSAPKKAR